jgi:hypothetical protein
MGTGAGFIGHAVPFGQWRGRYGYARGGIFWSITSCGSRSAAFSVSASARVGSSVFAGPSSFGGQGGAAWRAWTVTAPSDHAGDDDRPRRHRWSLRARSARRRARVVTCVLLAMRARAGSLRVGAGRRPSSLASSRELVDPFHVHRVRRRSCDHRKRKSSDAGQVSREAGAANAAHLAPISVRSGLPRSAAAARRCRGAATAVLADVVAPRLRRPRARSASIRLWSVASHASSSAAVASGANGSFSRSAKGRPRQSSSASRSVRAAASRAATDEVGAPRIAKPLEPMQIELAVGDLDDIAGRSRHDHAVRLKQLAQPRDVLVERGLRVLRQSISPWLVDQPATRRSIRSGVTREAPPSGRRAPQIGQDGQHAPVLVGVGRGPSFWKIAVTCFATAASVTEGLGYPWLDLPSAIAARTSRSRGLRRSSGPCLRRRPSIRPTPLDRARCRPPRPARWPGRMPRRRPRAP